MRNKSALLKGMDNMFGGHVPDNVEEAKSYDPQGSRRAVVVVKPWPNKPRGRVGIVDLLHPTETDTPRCDNPNCRCNRYRESEDV